MASNDRSPRLSEGASTVRTVEEVILHLNLIRQQLQQTILLNQRILDTAKARRNVDNGMPNRPFGERSVTPIT